MCELPVSSRKLSSNVAIIYRTLRIYWSGVDEITLGSFSYTRYTGYTGFKACGETYSTYPAASIMLLRFLKSRISFSLFRSWRIEVQNRRIEMLLSWLAWHCNESHNFQHMRRGQHEPMPAAQLQHQNKPGLRNVHRLWLLVDTIHVVFKYKLPGVHSTISYVAAHIRFLNRSRSIVEAVNLYWWNSWMWITS